MIVKAKDLQAGDEFIYRDELYRVTVNEVDAYSKDAYRRVSTYVVERPRTAPQLFWWPDEEDVTLERRRFGGPEDPAEVRADQLEPGVRISGDSFDRPVTLTVQDVRPEGEGKVSIEAADVEDGRLFTRAFRADRTMTAWGKI